MASLIPVAPLIARAQSRAEACPRLDESLLCARKAAADAFDGVERERGECVLIQGMKMRTVVRDADLHEHSNQPRARTFAIFARRGAHRLHARLEAALYHTTLG